MASCGNRLCWSTSGAYLAMISSARERAFSTMPDCSAFNRYIRALLLVLLLHSRSQKELQGRTQAQLKFQRPAQGVIERGAPERLLPESFQSLGLGVGRDIEGSLNARNAGMALFADDVKGHQRIMQATGSGEFKRIERQPLFVRDGTKGGGEIGG